ncbi:MAG: hypothetical protein PHS49_01740 [Candidatus Gracilibacteria bacterium]|nr:hypothetical protein [Candidatus Gracilibacteria bacterium]
MNKTKLYNDYLSKLETAIIADDMDSINYILEYLYTNQLPEDDMEAIDDILQEATLYSELGELEYKEEALRLISEFK